MARFARLRLVGLRGFTLVEIVVALVIVLILAAVALPSVGGVLQQKRVQAAADQLTTIANAIWRFNTDVNNTYPGRLSELSSPIVSGNSSYATGTDDSCGGTFTVAQRDNWAQTGPFVNFVIDRDSGMVTPIGRARDSLTRDPNSNTAGHLVVNFISSVEVGDAALLDTLTDAATGSAAGSIRWGVVGANGLVSMFARIPINNDC